MGDNNTKYPNPSPSDDYPGKLEVEEYIRSTNKPKFNHFVACNKDNIAHWSLAKHGGLTTDQLFQLWKQRFSLAFGNSNKPQLSDTLAGKADTTWKNIKDLVASTVEANDQYAVSGMKALTEVATMTEARFARSVQAITVPSSTNTQAGVSPLCDRDSPIPDTLSNTMTCLDKDFGNDDFPIDAQPVSPTNDRLPSPVPARTILNPTPTPALGSLAEFTSNFARMKDEHKWRLTSGRYVEDVLYNVGLSQTKENICHSFVIDLSDPMIKGAFDQDEWDQVTSTNVKGDIKLDQEVKELLEALNKTSTQAIRQVLAQKLPVYLMMPQDQAFEQIQICYAALSLIMLYEMSPCPLITPQLELWYECNVWVPLLDKLYGDIHGVQCVRGESANLSAKRRKSHDGSGDAGVKNDFIVRSVGGGHLLEFACGETSCTYHDGVDAKHLYESSLKVPKSLRDMLIDLCRSVDWNPTMVNKLEVVGYLHHGLVAQHLILDNPHGYICRLTRSKKCQVPSLSIDFPLVLELMAINLKLKKRAHRTIATLRQRPLDLDSDIFDRSISPTLPPTFTTPQRPQGKYKKRSIQDLYFRD